MKILKSPLLPWAIVLICLIGIWFVWGWYQGAKATTNGLVSISKAQSDSIHTFTAKDGEILSQKLAAETNNATLTLLLSEKTQEANDLTKALADAKMLAKNLQSATTIATQTGFSGNNTPPPIKLKPDSLGRKNTFTFDKKTNYYHISGIVDTALRFTNLLFTDTMHVLIGVQHTGFLRLKSSFIVSVENSSPYSKVYGLDNITVVKDKSIFSNFWFHFGLGVVAGVVSIRYLTK